MKRICLFLAFLPLLSHACTHTLPAISVAGSPCSGNALIVSCNLKPARIVWKLNGNIVDSVNATWNPMGIIVAGGNGAGPGLNKLNSPTYVYVDTLGNIFVSDGANTRVMKWPPGAALGYTTGVVVAGGNGCCMGYMDQFNSYPQGIKFDCTGNMFIADYGARVMEWAPGATSGIVVAGQPIMAGNELDQLDEPIGICVDNDTIYIADYDNSRIQKWAPGDTVGITIAGTCVPGGGYNSGVGFAADQLHGPEDVFLDKDRNMFVADCFNYRVQKFAPGSVSGTAAITVAGGNGYGYATNQCLPASLYVDGLGNIYIMDCNQQSSRVQQWIPGATNGITIAGGNGIGSSLNQFNTPGGIFLDDSGNLYVADGWNNRVLKFLSGIANTYNVTTTGTYTVTVYDFNGDSITDTVTVPTPTTTITAIPDTNILMGQSVTFTATTANGGNSPTYQWYKDGVAIPGATNITYTSNTLSNNDSITIVMHSSEACVQPDTAVSNLLVIHVCPPTNNIRIDTTVCINEEVLLHIPGDTSGISSVQWSPSSFLNNNSINDPTCTPSSSITYQVTVDYTGYCKPTIDTVDVFVSNLTKPVVTDTFICEGVPAPVLNVTGDSLTWYTALNGAGIPIQPLITTQVAGYDTLYVANRCAEVPVYVQIVAIPNAVLGNDTAICNGGALQLNALVQNNVHYKWNTGDTTCCIMVSATGEYVIEVSNVCGTTPDSEHVAFDDCEECLSVPNAFTPNNDGKNDRFHVIDRCGVGTYHIIIVNRWGQIVYDSFNISDSWDGTFNSQPVDIGTYYYSIIATPQITGTQISLKGDITIIR